MISITELGPITTTYDYDAAGNLRFVLDPRQTLAYVAAGEPDLFAGAAFANVTEYRYDARNRLEREILPVPGGATETDQTRTETGYSYDANDNLVSVTTPLGTSTHAYDERNLRTSTTEPAPNVAGSLHGAPLTEFAYDTLGNLRLVRDARSNETGLSQNAVSTRSAKCPMELTSSPLPKWIAASPDFSRHASQNAPSNVS